MGRQVKNGKTKQTNESHRSHKARLENMKIINATNAQLELHDIHTQKEETHGRINKLIKHIQQIHASNEESSCGIAAKPKAAEGRAGSQKKPKARSQKPEAKASPPKKIKRMPLQ